MGKLQRTLEERTPFTTVMPTVAWWSGEVAGQKKKLNQGGDNTDCKCQVGSNDGMCPHCSREEHEEHALEIGEAINWAHSMSNTKKKGGETTKNPPRPGGGRPKKVMNGIMPTLNCVNPGARFLPAPTALPPGPGGFDCTDCQVQSYDGMCPHCLTEEHESDGWCCSRGC